MNIASTTLRPQQKVLISKHSEGNSTSALSDIVGDSSESCKTGGPTKHYNEKHYLVTQQWRYRIIDELRHARAEGRDTWFITLTLDPKWYCSERTLLQRGDAYLKRLKYFLKNVKAPAYKQMLQEWKDKPDPITGCWESNYRHFIKSNGSPGKFRYLMVLERGSESGRLHLHMILIFPFRWKYKDFKLDLTRWPYGKIQEFKKVKLDDEGSCRRTSTYLSKYVTKQSRRISCSSKFGLTTIIGLLSTLNFQRLALADLRMAQKLLQRLSLTKSYPTSKLMKYLILRDKQSTTSQQLSILLQQKMTIGEINSDVENYNSVCSTSPAYRRAVAAIVKATVEELRWGSSDFTRRVFGTENIERVLPGLGYFGARAIGSKWNASRRVATYQDSRIFRARVVNGWRFRQGSKLYDLRMGKCRRLANELTRDSIYAEIAKEICKYFTRSGVSTSDYDEYQVWVKQKTGAEQTTPRHQNRWQIC